MSYKVESSIPDLIGECEISGGQCTSYTSTNLQQTVTPTNENGNKLKFKVQFSTSPKPYKIDATEKDDGDKYDGNATLDDDDSDYVGDDNWHATAISPLAASATSE
jgi:hypothetical protein